MQNFTRRAFALSALAGASVTAGCGNGLNSQGSETIDARVEATLNQLYTNYPNTRDLANRAAGKLVMPLMTEVGFGIGGGYGRGALLMDGITSDYYSSTKGSFGLQFGAQQYAHVLFFMTEAALDEFRRSAGWVAGADIEYVLADIGQNASADTTTALSPVIAVIFGKAGLHVGATLEGKKYTRIIP